MESDSEGTSPCDWSIDAYVSLAQSDTVEQSGSAGRASPRFHWPWCNESVPAYLFNVVGNNFRFGANVSSAGADS